MRVLLLISILFCFQDTTRVDTTQKEVKLFFEQRTHLQKAIDINTKLDLLILKLEIKKDTAQ